MDPTINPYADHTRSSSSSVDQLAGSGTAVRNESMVKQLPILCTIQIILGLLELMIASLLLISAVFIPFAITQASKQDPSQPPFPKELLSMMVYYYIIVGGLTLLFGMFRIVAGIRNYSFRGRTLMMIALLGGLVSIGTFYCAIFTIGAAVYGMILMLHPAIKKGYELGSSGMKSEEIFAFFAAAKQQELNGMGHDARSSAVPPISS